ncbi:MAG: sugar kinase, partial [Chloroflexi bacterium]|nr:sugar kinase [Chloroflexota bacterium]
MVDVVTLGEAMLRLSPPGHERLETATSFNVVVGGSELNVAVALAHLGRSVQFLTKLPRSPLGRLVIHRSHEHGVGTDFTVWSDDRLGLYFYEAGLTPRPSQVFYDRAESAASRLTATEIDWSTAFQHARIFHTSGITAALSPASFQTVKVSLQAARELDLLCIFDLNY